MSGSPGRREVAHRVFAAEYDDATLQYSESDEERAPNYVVTPTGARVNRLFLVGVLTEVEQVGEDVVRARVADPTGVFVVYAGQYQPDALAFFERADPPMFVAVTGKARTFSPDGSDRIFTSVRPESVNEVDALTRDRWTVQTAEHTLARVATFAAALESGLPGDDLRAALSASGVPESLSAGVPRALDHYGTTEAYLAGTADVALDALRLVADEVDEVTVPDLEPDAAGPGTVDRDALADVPGAVVDLRTDLETAGDESEDRPGSTTDAGAESPGGRETESAGEPESGAAAEPGAEPGASDAGDASAAEAAGATDTTAADVPDDDATAAEATADEAATGDATGDAADDGVTDAGATGSDTAADAPAEPADEPDADLGDFEPGGDLGDESGATGAESPGGDAGEAATGADLDAEPAEDVLDEEERERIEQEYGTEFSTGTEVDEPGQAGIEPEAAEAGAADEAADADAATTGETATGAGDGPAGAGAEPTAETESEPEGNAEPAGKSEQAGESEPAEDAGSEPDAEPAAEDEGAGTEDVDLEAAVLEAMDDLDEGDGADREALVAAVVDEYGVDPGAVEDAIQDALMAGKCYEPADGRVTSI